MNTARLLCLMLVCCITPATNAAQPIRRPVDQPKHSVKFDPVLYRWAKKHRLWRWVNCSDKKIIWTCKHGRDGRGNEEDLQNTFTVTGYEHITVKECDQRNAGLTRAVCWWAAGTAMAFGAFLLRPTQEVTSNSRYGAFSFCMLGAIYTLAKAATSWFSYNQWRKTAIIDVRKATEKCQKLDTNMRQNSDIRFTAAHEEWSGYLAVRASHTCFPWTSGTWRDRTEDRICEDCVEYVDKVDKGDCLVSPGKTPGHLYPFDAPHTTVAELARQQRDESAEA